MALKYNPLLKYNLQESEDAAEILGDGYNEKLLNENDFINDSENIITDTGIVRHYTFSNRINNQYNPHFSFALWLNNFSVSIRPAGTNTGTLYGKSCFFYNGILGSFWITSYSTNLYIVNCVIDAAPLFNLYIKNFQNVYFINTKKAPITIGCQDNYVNVYILNCSNQFTFTNCSKCNVIANGANITNVNSDFANFINIDSTLDINSRGLLPNSVITAALQALQPDSSLDADSNKPVMNSAVTHEINTITQIIENFQDINVANLTEFENAIQTGQNANVRIHLTTDITLTQSVTYNLDKIQIYGHDNKINLQNFTFTIEGETAYFYQVRFNANSAVGAYSANNYSDAQINIISTVSSARYFFEYVIFLNFVCKNTDNQATDYVRTLFDVKTTAGVNSASLHLYFMFCESMTNYEQSNINNLCLAINHSGTATADNNDDPNSTKLHALTVHNVDYWGNAQEANSCSNWTFSGNALNGKKKLGWISDGSSVYATRTNSLTPSFVNQYNPSYNEFLTLKNSFTFQTFNDIKVNSYTSYQVVCYTTVYYNNYIAIVKFYTVGSGNIPPGAFSNKIPIILIDSIQLDSNVQVNAEADGFTLVSVNQTAPGMYGTFTMPILQN